MSDDFFDILNGFTKEEIITWEREHIWKGTPPKRSELLWIRWNLRSKRQIVEQDALNQQFRGIDFATRDKYAEQFNLSKDINEKKLIAEKLSVYEDKLKEWFIKNDKLRKKGAILDKILVQYEQEREKELIEQRNA